MDAVLSYADAHLLDSLYTTLPPFSLPALQPYFSHRDSLTRQAFSLWIVVWLSGAVMYFVFATASYVLLFDKALEKHPKFLKNQKSKEIALTMQSMPIMSLLTVPWFLGEVRGYAKLYDNISDYSLFYTVFSFFWFLLFTDCLIYWIHRWEHHPSVYGWLHKPHHYWKISTPFASHAFHPLDGYFQSIPYHIFVFLFPFNKYLYLGTFVFVNFWTISIHDQLYIAEDSLINGAAHHTVHHREFNYNYGQYFTLWDRLGGSYKKPEEFFDEKHTGHKYEMPVDAKADLEGDGMGERVVVSNGNVGNGKANGVGKVVGEVNETPRRSARARKAQ